jgi:ATP-dependent DNA helicase 2 subunit 2
MADKEATVYIVDIGKSMGKKNQGREQTDLDWSLQYVWDRITTTVNIFILATVFNMLIAGA